MALRPYELLMGTRLVFAAALAAALPLSHLWWGHSPEEAGIDGQQAMSFIVIFAGIGLFVALGYFAVASALHFFFRRAPRRVALFDIALAIPLIALLIIGGVTARYGP